MAHEHNVTDTGVHFEIDATTRQITIDSGTDTIMQFDHNSERLTFELPRYIDGHDMTQCNVVQVHYINVDSSTRESNADVYEVTDLKASTEDENTLVLSWLISGNATKYAGTLNFVIKFKCVTDGAVDYAWGTAIYKGLTVSNGMDNGDAVAEEYSDILASWEARISALEEGGAGGTPNAVQFVPQELTEDQKAQARENIDAASHETVVEALGEYAESWEHTDAELVSGWQWNVNTKDKYSNYYSQYYLVPCVEGDEFLVSTAESGNAPCAMFYSGEPSPDTFIYFYGEKGLGENVNYYVNELVVAPVGSKYAAFNNFTNCDAHDFSVQKKEKTLVGGTLTKMVLDAIGTQVDEWVGTDSPIDIGLEYNVNVKGPYEWSNSKSCLVPCKDGDEFLVSSTTDGNAPCAVFFSGDPSSATYMSYYGTRGTKTTYTQERVAVPSGCKYVGFNALRYEGIFVVLEKTKVWEGGTLSTKANAAAKKCIEVTYAGSELTMRGQDVGLVFGITSVNNTFAIKKILKKSGGTTIGTDMVSPYIIEVNDGVEGVSSFHTGGHHGTDNGSGNPTARCTSYAVYVDGEAVESVDKKLCNYVMIDVVNYVQAGNTFVDGSGREAIKEIIHYKFDGSKLYITTEIEALEDLRINYYHFIQSTAYNASAKYIGDGTKLVVHGFSEGGGTDMWVDYAILTDSNGETLKMHVEKTGLAMLEPSGAQYTNGGRFYWSTGKCGWNIVNAWGEHGFAMSAGEKTMCTGYFDFAPSVVITE